MHDCQRKSRGYRRVDSIAAFAQNLNTRIRGEVMHADHHAVLRVNRLLAAIGEYVGRPFLGDRDGERHQCEGHTSGKCRERGEAINGLHSFRQNKLRGAVSSDLCYGERPAIQGVSHQKNGADGIAPVCPIDVRFIDRYISSTSFRIASSCLTCKRAFEGTPPDTLRRGSNPSSSRTARLTSSRELKARYSGCSYFSQFSDRFEPIVSCVESPLTITTMLSSES